MAKNKQVGKALNFVVWLTGVLVSLSVGFGMTNGTLILPSWIGGNFNGGIVAIIVGWVVIITTVISAVLAVIDGAR